MSGLSTTIIPFADLPACAQKCGPLYDANGACVPPAVPQADTKVYNTCFCNQAVLQPFKTSATTVCPPAGCDSAGFNSIQAWYISFCNSVTGSASPNQPSSSAKPNSSSASSKGTVPPPSNAKGGTWLSNHWQWVVMLVILVVAIAGIWIGACIWRRRYLRRKDRMYELGKHAHKGPSGIIAGSGVNVNQSGNVHGPGQFMSGSSSGLYNEKPPKDKKWVVDQRT